MGDAASIADGDAVPLSGTWFNDRMHGLQFWVGCLKASRPTTLEPIKRYFNSGMIRGIGPACAGKLVCAQGEAVFDLIGAELGRFHEVTSIGRQLAARMVTGEPSRR